jgi:hypothetical protein
MQTPPNFNDQQNWGGQGFQPQAEPGPMGFSTVSDEQTTFVARDRQDLRPQLSSQGGVIASSSDNLFHPVSNNPPPAFNLPDIPSHSRFRAYNHSPFSRPLPYPSTFSSYNNPSFAVPPQPARAFYNNIHSLHTHIPLDHHPPNHVPLDHHPPIPARISPLPQIDNHQPSHNYFVPPHHPSHQIPPSYHPPVPVPVPSPAPSSSSTVHSLSKTLPTVTHIPTLTSKHDFFPWDEGVQALIRANGLIGHILDPTAFVDPSRPDLAPTPPPVLSMSSSPREIEMSNRWWGEDNIVQHILLSRLGSVPRGLLPSSNSNTRTALSIYKLLVQYYGICNFADCTELLNSLHNSLCTTGRVSEFVSKWRIGLAKLQSAQYAFNIKISISMFVRGLPSIPAFNTLRADLPRRIAAIPHDHDYGAFIDLTETVLELDTIFRPTSQPLASRPPRTTSIPPTVTALPVSTIPSSSTTTSDSSTRVPKKDLVCLNCKSRGLRCVGHTDGTCFQPGGGMAGRREEYMNNRGRIHAMFAECLEEAFSIPDQDLPPDPGSATASPVLSSTPDSDLLLPPLANLCVTPFSINPDVRQDLYYWCDHKSPSHLAYTSADFQTTTFLSMANVFNALLDSGCTHHIIRDRALFRNYTSKAISVGTANCGSLAAHGTGDVEFRYPFGNRHVTFTLRGCLYAPSAPINLFSVGALAERGMSCLFSPGGITKISYPVDHAKLPGFSFEATVSNRLSFLKLDFISPDVSAGSIAFPALAPVPSLSTTSRPVLPVVPSSATSLSSSSFPRLKLDSMLWHRRFGHIGMDATRAALTKDYVTGVKLDGSFVRNYCISCIVGKSPQKSYPLRGNRASAVGELLHMDLCGPFLVFKGPVAWTGKKTGTGPDATDCNRTVGCGCVRFYDLSVAGCSF